DLKLKILLALKVRFQMKKIKPILLIEFNSPVLSGGNRRLYEILRNGKNEGIEYIVFTDYSSCKNAVKMFPDYLEVLSNYTFYLSNFIEKASSLFGLKHFFFCRKILLSALLVSKIAIDENADLIVGGEELQSILISCIAGKLSSKPWTAIFQPTTYLLQPSKRTWGLNIFNILRFLGEKLEGDISMITKIGIAIGTLTQLKTAEKSLMLSVSASVAEELKPLNPKIKFYSIEPGNGIEQKKFDQKQKRGQSYDAIFFARLIPEKGFLDLPKIWRYVVKKEPTAQLAVAGITEDQSYLKKFLEIVHNEGLDANITFLGKLGETALINLVKAAKFLLYPSLVDSFSLVTLESLACGTPVIAYDIPALRYNFGKCEAVIRCPVKDKSSMAEAVLTLIKNKELRQSLSLVAKKYSESYTWQNVAKAEKAAYFEVIRYSKRKLT
ncbi:MAG: glycosyltransferase family 4 protein, partial [Promethearchaeota archaeon]